MLQIQLVEIISKKKIISLLNVNKMVDNVLKEIVENIKLIS